MTATTDMAPAFTGRDVDDLAGPPAKAELPPPPIIDPPTPDTPPKAAKRPTTRAGRRAAAEARRLQGGGAAPKADKPPKASAPAPRKASLETRLTNQLVGIGTVVAGVGGMVSPAFQADGVLIVAHSADVAKALDKVAQDQPQVKAALERMMTAGVWGGLTMALMPLVVGIAANHGAIPASVAAMVGAQVPTQPEEPQAAPGYAGAVEPIHVG